MLGLARIMGIQDRISDYSVAMVGRGIEKVWTLRLAGAHSPMKWIPMLRIALRVRLRYAALRMTWGQKPSPVEKGDRARGSPKRAKASFGG